MCLDNLYKFEIFCYLNNMCVRCGCQVSWFTDHFSLELSTLCLETGDISHNQDKMLNTQGDKWGLARNGIGKMPTSCWNIRNISCWIFHIKESSFFPLTFWKYIFTILLFDYNIEYLVSREDQVVSVWYLLLLSHVTFNVKYKWIMDYNNKSHSDIISWISRYYSQFILRKSHFVIWILTGRFFSTFEMYFIESTREGYRS